MNKLKQKLKLTSKMEHASDKEPGDDIAEVSGLHLDQSDNVSIYLCDSLLLGNILYKYKII